MSGPESRTIIGLNSLPKASRPATRAALLPVSAAFLSLSTGISVTLSDHFIFSRTLAQRIGLGLNAALELGLGIIQVLGRLGPSIKDPVLYAALFYNLNFIQIAFDPDPVKRLTRTFTCHQ